MSMAKRNKLPKVIKAINQVTETKTQEVKPADTKKAKKVSAKKLDTKNVKATVKQVVKSMREIKYNYPAGMEDQLDRKAWRQKTRNTLKSLEASYMKAKEGKAKNAGELKLKFEDFKKAVLL